MNFVYVSEKGRLGFASVIVNIAAEIRDFCDFGFAIGFRIGERVKHNADAVFSWVKVVSIRRALNIGGDVRMKNSELSSAHQTGPLGWFSGGVVELEYLHR